MANGLLTMTKDSCMSRLSDCCSDITALDGRYIDLISEGKVLPLVPAILESCLLP